MDIFALYETDESLESDGVWQSLGDSKFKIARLGNPKYSAMVKKLFDENAKALDVPGAASDKLSQDLLIQVWARTILLDWEGVTRAGTNIPYSIASAEAALALKDFRKVILGFADSLNTYLKKQEDAIAKN